MNMLIREIKNNRKLYGIISFISIIIYINVITMDPFYSGDFSSYIAHSIIRPPVLPLIFDIFQFIFGSHWVFFLCAVQTLILVGAIIYFLIVLNVTYNLKSIISLGIFFVLISPLYSLELGNFLGTEYLAYALFLIIASFLVRLINNLEIFLFGQLAFVLMIIVLLRSQMNFILLICLFMITFFSIKKKNLILFYKCVAILMLTVLLANMLRSGYNFYHHNTFSLLGAGMHLGCDIIFVSDSSDLPLFKNKPYYDSIKTIYQNMDNQKLFSKYRYDVELPMAIFSLQRASLIAGTVNNPLYLYVSGHPVDYENWKPDDGWIWLGMNKIQMDIFKVLLPIRYKDYARLIVSRVIKEISFLEAILFCTFILLALRYDVKPLTFLVFASLAHIINIVSVSMITYNVYRYKFYTQILFLVALLVIFNYLFFLWKDLFDHQLTCNNSTVEN